MEGNNKMLKIKLVKSKGKWSKRMDKIIPHKLSCIYTKMLFEGLTNQTVVVK